MKKIKNILFVFCISLVMISCSEDKLGNSIFDTTDNVLDPNSATYSFDAWLRQNYLTTYNLDFMYKMEDVASDIEYNLIPTTYEKSQEMAKLIKYLWFEVYDTVAGEEFLKMYGPRMIHLIGSPAYNASLGTITLGTAEGGIKVTIYNCNAVNRNNVSALNESYFKTIHHEFAHILHQTKTYPKEFAQISAGYYNPTSWYDSATSEANANSRGFVTKYASSAVREDFVEVIANYLVKSDAEWENILRLAATTTNNVGITNGDEIIRTKLEMCRDWLRDSWNIDIDELRDEIRRRQANLDVIDELYNF